MKHILLTFLLFFACFGGQEAMAMPGATAAESGVRQDESIAQGELYAWPGALPELERLFSAQAPPTTPLKQHSSPGFGTMALDLEQWLQQGIGRQIAIGRMCPVSLSGTRIIFPFHYFW